MPSPPSDSCSTCPFSWAATKVMKRPDVAVTALTLLLAGAVIWYFFPALEEWVGVTQQHYAGWIEPGTFNRHLWLLIPVGFLGGLLASVSPCVLALLPLNLSYMGTLEVNSKLEAIRNATLFVLGVVLVLSLMGLVSSFAGALMVDYKGYINIVVGLLAALMGLVILEVIHLPVTTGIQRMPAGAGPFIVGSVFALVSSPCASPVLFSMLAIAGSSGDIIVSTASMASYALGYSAVLFLASVLTGFAKGVGRLKQYAGTITILGGIFLVIVGGYFVYEGYRWFFPG